MRPSFRAFAFPVALAIVPGCAAWRAFSDVAPVACAAVGASLDAGAIEPLSSSDGGTPTEPMFPDPARPSPTLPLPPPAAMASATLGR